MSDLIKREDAIQAVIAQRHKAELSEHNFALRLAEDAIRCLPPADPPYQYSIAYVEQIRGERDILQDMVDNMAEPKTGRWVRVGYDIYECSLCHQNVMTKDIDCYSYCHGCGANMEGGEDK